MKVRESTYKCRVVRVIDPINFEVIVDMGLGISYTCKVKLAGAKYQKYDKQDQNEYDKFMKTRDEVRSCLSSSTLNIVFVTNYKDKSGKYLVDFEDGGVSLKEKLISLNILEELIDRPVR